MDYRWLRLISVPFFLGAVALLVIGGLMKDRKTTTVFKVPFLGSIPLLGVLFRRDTVDTEKTELLVFLTATIRNPADEKGVEAPASVSAKTMDFEPIPVTEKKKGEAGK